MASSSAQIHFRSLSGSTMSRRPSVGYRSSLDLKADDDALDHQALLASNAARPARLPRTYRCLRTSAFIGWTLSFLLLITLVVSHSTMAPEIPRVDLRGMALSGGRAVVGAPDVGVAATVLKDLPQADKAVVAGQKELAYPQRAGGLQSRVTIVSGFYRIDSGKKHRVSEYHEWLTTFLRSVELPIVFYCAPELRAYVKGLRGSKPITIIDDYETPFSMPPLEDLGGRDWAVAQHKIDPEKHVHVPDVYGIWTAKPWIVKHAKDLDPYHSDYFFWVDAGGFRESNVVHSFNGLASALDKIYDTVPDDTLILSATTLPFEAGLEYVKGAKKGGELDRGDRLQGGWYGGKKAGVDWWEKETMKVTILQAAMQKFAAKEQPVWTQAARLNWPKIYVQNMAWRTGPDCGPDMWFAFEQFADGDDCDIPAWNGPQYAKDLEGAAEKGSSLVGSREGGRVQRLR